MLEHGGRLLAASHQYGIALEQWLDLSTGINPHGWPVPALSPACWQRLPEEGDGLEHAAATYYRNSRLLAVPGSQAAIQLLPHCFGAGVSVACVAPLYDEHPHAWRRAGHDVVRVHVNGVALASAVAAGTKLVLLCNPNNPTAHTHTRAELIAAAARLRARGGWLLVDEAFADADPDDSVVDLAGTAEAPNLIVLRSVGKFFGLAGIRVGFVFAQQDLLQRVGEAVGPWAVAGPSREAARLALADLAWQDQTRTRLRVASQRLLRLLSPLGPVAATALFAVLRTERAQALYEFLARHAILVRSYPDQPFVRFGLPDSESAWQRLSGALDSFQRQLG